MPPAIGDLLQICGVDHALRLPWHRCGRAVYLCVRMALRLPLHLFRDD